MNWYSAVLKNYAGFSGRARRTEYWMFVLFNAIVEAVLESLYAATHSGFLTVLSGIYGLAVLIPGLAVTFRRLHDTNRSGGWIFIGLVPLVGAIILIVFLATAGTQGVNKFGSDPKQMDASGRQASQPNYQA